MVARFERWERRIRPPPSPLTLYVQDTPYPNFFFFLSLFSRVGAELSYLPLFFFLGFSSALISKLIATRAGFLGSFAKRKVLKQKTEKEKVVGLIVSLINKGLSEKEILDSLVEAGYSKEHSARIIKTLRSS